MEQEYQQIRSQYHSLLKKIKFFDLENVHETLFVDSLEIKLCLEYEIKYLYNTFLKGVPTKEILVILKKVTLTLIGKITQNLSHYVGIY